MKKRIGIAFALAMVATLGFSSVALADEPDDPIELYAEGDSTAEWVTDPVKEGDHAVELTMPAGTGWVDDNAEVRIDIPDAPKLSDVIGWSFWATGLGAYYPPIEFYIDTDGFKGPDKVIVGQRMGSMTSDWVELDQANMSMYMAWKNGYEWLWNWGKVQEKYGDAALARVDIGYGSLGSNEAITAYIDDFTLMSTVYSLEPPPPPTPTTRIRIILPDASEWFQYCGKAVRSIDFNDGTWRIQIPAGTWVLRPDNSMAVRLVIDSEGNIVSDVHFVYCRGGEVTITRM